MNSTNHVNIQSLFNIIFPNVDLVIEFSNSTYSVNEGDSSVTVLVTKMVDIERDVTLNIATMDGRATAGTYLCTYISTLKNLFFFFQKKSILCPLFEMYIWSHCIILLSRYLLLKYKRLSNQDTSLIRTPF